MTLVLRFLAKFMLHFCKHLAHNSHVKRHLSIMVKTCTQLHSNLADSSHCVPSTNLHFDEFVIIINAGLIRVVFKLFYSKLCARLNQAIIKFS